MSPKQKAKTMTTKNSTIRMTAAEGKIPEIFIYDEIGASPFFDIFSAKDLQFSLDMIGDVEEVYLNVNCIGGDPTQGVAMHSIIENHPAKFTAFVDGLAASTATVPLCACDVVRVRRGAQVMIHEPEVTKRGRASDLIKAIGQLSSMQESVIDIYEAKTGKSRESLAKMMNDETWMTAQEAKNEGFADEVDERQAIEMKFKLSMTANFKNTPGALLSPENDPDTPEVKTVKMSKETPAEGAIVMSAEQFATFRSDLIKEVKDSIVPAGPTEDEKKLEMAVKAERLRVANITSTCEMADIGQVEMNAFIDEGKTLSEVQGVAIKAMSMKNTPAGEGEQNGEDGTAAYRKEFKDVSGGISMTMNENEYVNVRLREDGKQEIDFDAK